MSHLPETIRDMQLLSNHSFDICIHQQLDMEIGILPAVRRAFNRERVNAL